MPVSPEIEGTYHLVLISFFLLKWHRSYHYYLFFCKSEIYFQKRSMKMHKKSPSLLFSTNSLIYFVKSLHLYTFNVNFFVVALSLSDILLFVVFRARDLSTGIWAPPFGYRVLFWYSLLEILIFYDEKLHHLYFSFDSTVHFNEFTF